MTPAEHDLIRAWIARLEAELAGDDPALRRDAVADATEHLAEELAQLGPMPDDGAIVAVLDAYGDAADVAESYRQAERIVGAGLPAFTQHHDAVAPAPSQPVRQARWFGVLVDPDAWSALLYMLLALPLGIAWFTWVVAGGATSLSLLILIIGVPLALAFLAGTRGIALLDGRIVEALLGERMPRRPIPVPRGISGEGIVARISYWLRDARTWTSLVYLALMLPLGTAYFVVAVVLGAIAGGMLAAPVLVVLQAIDSDSGNGWLWVVAVLGIPAGLLALLGLLHVARVIGAVHGRLAKAMLVGGDGQASRRRPVSIGGSAGRAVVLLVAAGLLVGGTALSGRAYVHDHSAKLTRTHEATDVRSLAIDVDTADVDVAGSRDLDPGEVRIEVRGRVSEDVSASDVIRFDEADGAATLSVECPDSAAWFELGCDLDVHVLVSAQDDDLRVRVSADTGDIDLLGLRARSIDVATDTGDIEGDADALTVSVRSSNGDVELVAHDRCERLDVRTDTGDVELVVANDWHVDARSDTGDVEVDVPTDEGAERELVAVSNTGDVEIVSRPAPPAAPSAPAPPG